MACSAISIHQTPLMHNQLQITETSHEFNVPTVKWSHGWVHVTVEKTQLFQAFCEIALKSTQLFRKKKSAPLGNGLGVWMSFGRMHRHACWDSGEAGRALGNLGTTGRDARCCPRAGCWLWLGRWGSSHCIGLQWGACWHWSPKLDRGRLSPVLALHLQRVPLSGPWACSATDITGTHGRSCSGCSAQAGSCSTLGLVGLGDGMGASGLAGNHRKHCTTELISTRTKSSLGVKITLEKQSQSPVMECLSCSGCFLISLSNPKVPPFRPACTAHSLHPQAWWYYQDHRNHLWRIKWLPCSSLPLKKQSLPFLYHRHRVSVLQKVEFCTKRKRNASKQNAVPWCYSIWDPLDISCGSTVWIRSFSSSFANRAVGAANISVWLVNKEIREKWISSAQAELHFLQQW